MGLAFLDIDGKVLDVASGKNLSVNDVIFEIEQHGDLLILACDRNPIPQTVEKIGASFRCKLFYPDYLSSAEKKELVKRYKTNNNHEKDALAAALKAYNSISPKLLNLKKRYRADFPDKVRELILKW